MPYKASCIAEFQDERADEEGADRPEGHDAETLLDLFNLGKQAKLEFDKFTIQETQRKFPAEYNVQHLTHNAIDTTARVCVSTLQRIFSILKGEAELEQEIDEHPVCELPVAEPVEEMYDPQPVVVGAERTRPGAYGLGAK